MTVSDWLTAPSSESRKVRTSGSGQQRIAFVPRTRPVPAVQVRPGDELTPA